jgi:hypothetical protein
VSTGTGVAGTNDSVDALTVADIALSQWSTGVAAADASTVRVENASIAATVNGITAANVSTVTVADSRLSAGTAGAFHDVEAVRLRNVTGGRLVFDDGTRVEASNITFTGKRAVGFSGRNVTVDEATDAPRAPSGYTPVGPALTTSKAGSNATVTVSLPVEAPPGTPNESLSVWRYDGNWSELRTTRDDGRLVATLSPDDDPVVVTALGATEPHLVTARSSDALSSTVGNETTIDVTVRNVGTEAYVLTNVTLRGPNASQFSVVADSLESTTPTPDTTPTPNATATPTPSTPSTTASKRTALSTPGATRGTLIPPGSSHRVTVVFAPDSATTQRATLVFDRATHADDATVTLVGTAAASATSVTDGPDGGDSPHEDDCDVDSSEVVTDDQGRRVIRVSDNLYCVLNPRLPSQSRERPPKTTPPSSPPVVDVPTVTTTLTATTTPTATTATVTSPERSTTARTSPTATAASPTDVSSPRRTTAAPTTAPPPSTTPVTTPGLGAVPVVVAFGALVLVIRRGRRGR